MDQQTYQHMLTNLTRPSGPVLLTPEASRLLLQAESHHQVIMDRLTLISRQGDGGVIFNRQHLPPGSPELAGYLMGIRTAIAIVGSFPIRRI